MGMCPACTQTDTDMDNGGLNRLARALQSARADLRSMSVHRREK